MGRGSCTTLVAAFVAGICLPAAVLGSPFVASARQAGLELRKNHDYEAQAAIVQHDGSSSDPLKEFIADVVHNAGTELGEGNKNKKNNHDKANKLTTSSSSLLLPTSSLFSSPSLSFSTTSTPPSSPAESSLRYWPVNHTNNGGPSIKDGEHDESTSLLRPSWFDSALVARRLLAKSPVGIASTVFQHTDSSPSPSPSQSSWPSNLQGVSISLPEYIADCPEEDEDSGSSSSRDDDNEVGNKGNPILLGLYVSTTFQNVARGSNISLSIDWWNHLNSTDSLYPGFPLSAAGLPRISLIGYIKKIDLPSSATTAATAAAAAKGTTGEVNALEECFFATHPDARAWAPGNPESPHSGFWARMVVTQVYWIGGFGDLQQIGWINMTEWRGIGRYGSDKSLGDGSGRGWEDVRLPGE